MAPFGFGPDGLDRARQIRRQRERDHEEQERERQLALKEEYLARGVDLDAPLEALACPRCKQRYAFGAECPDCGVYLVGLSALDKATPQRPYKERAWPLPIRLLALGIVVFGVLGFSALLLKQFL